MKPASKMYEFIERTINPLCGKCQYECKYCYVEKMKKRFKYINDKYSGVYRIDLSVLDKKYNKEELIFVGSCIDMFADNVPIYEIQFILDSLEVNEKPTFLFQTKNPKKFNYLVFPKNSILCITIETDNNKVYNMVSKSNITERIENAKKIIDRHVYPLHITIEPIIKFTPNFINHLREINPNQINIGADSGKNNLIEPTKDEILTLIKQLETFTKVHIKDTLNRLIK